MSNTTIAFMEEPNGYNKEQVISYIRKLSEAYQNTYEEYQGLSGKYESLAEEYGRLKAREQPGINAEVIMKTLVNAEVLARKITDDARSEAKEAAQRIMDEARAGAREAAQKIVDEAKNEAALMSYRARNSVEQARKAMGQVINELGKFFEPDAPEQENAAPL